jgi:hypothetical protein
MRGRRLLILAAVVGLGGCSREDEPPDPRQPAEGDEHIACAVSGQTELRPVCAVERARDDGGLTLTVRHPDGGFRRFDVLSDGSGLKVADGAQIAVARYDAGLADLSVGGDRYRFPITLKAPAPPQ